MREEGFFSPVRPEKKFVPDCAVFKKSCGREVFSLPRPTTIFKRHFFKIRQTALTPYHQCCFNAGPASQTVAQHWNNWVVIEVCHCNRGHEIRCNVTQWTLRHTSNVGFMLNQRLWRWPNNDPQSDQCLLFTGNVYITYQHGIYPSSFCKVNF